jgi:hypothetical protein
VDDLTYVSKICVNVYLLTMWITSILKCGLCFWTLMYVYVVCGFSCVDDIVYVVINILYVSI